MALFSITRYGDDRLAADESYERDNLEKLRRKIEDRRRALDESNRAPNRAETPTEEREDDEESIEEATPSEDVGEAKLRPSIDTSQFKVLGVPDFESKAKVKRYLPYWLRHPTRISLDLKEGSVRMEDASYLNDTLKKKLKSEGIERLFPVQAAVIPWLLEEHRTAAYFWPCDVCVSAPTGSGKTLAYVLPIVQLLTNRADRQIRALVVLPVKELATQVAQVFRDYCIGTNLKVALLVGGALPHSEASQLVESATVGGHRSKVDIVVCTPGRLVEHLQNTRGFSLRHLRFLVMDEADRMMQRIQHDWLHHLGRHGDFDESPAAAVSAHAMWRRRRRPPQKLFFSATLSQDPEKLEEWSMFQPRLFAVTREDSSKSIAKYATPLELREKYAVCELEHKPAALYLLLRDEARERSLVFLNSAQATHRLTVLLKGMMQDDGGRIVAELSSSLGQKARDSMLRGFQAGTINILICTDALARGIDVVDCDCVVSYDPPKNVKTYIHRVGRTGRAGKRGTAVSLLTENQVKRFQHLMRAAGKTDIERTPIEEERLESVAELVRAAAESFGEKMSAECDDRANRLRSLKRGKDLKRRDREGRAKRRKA